ncbi:MAG TPA: GTPase Era [Acidimicrobiales bacterium]|nr:GTPase Era [Acidimicrobiales bacterium]
MTTGTDPGAGLRSGFVTVVGRPNVGKSTLVNAVLGTKVTITSPRPNTTRRSVRGVLHRPGIQAVLVDTPGLHRPRSALGVRLNEHVDEALGDIDVVVAVLDATAPVGPGDRLVLERAAASSAAHHGPAGAPLHGLLVAVNKADRATPAQVLERLAEAHAAVEGEDGDAGAEYFPLSARTGAGVEALVEAVLARLPPGPPYFPPDMVSDVPEAFWVAELVREQLLARVEDELPHAIACRVTAWEWPHIGVDIVVERDSQKGIVIGKGGAVLKEVGIAVRAQLPPGAYLELRVRVDKRWQQRPEAIERLGY